MHYMEKGEDGIAQSYFEYLRVPYTHSGVVSSYKAMNKEVSKRYLKKKILTPKYFSLSKTDFKKRKIKFLLSNNKIKFPVVIKPLNEGSSLGVKITKNFNELIISSKTLFKSYEKLIFENYKRPRNSGCSFKQ